MSHSTNSTNAEKIPSFLVKYWKTFPAIVRATKKNRLQGQIMNLLLTIAVMNTTEKPRTGILKCQVYQGSIAHTLGTSTAVVSKELKKLKERLWIRVSQPRAITGHYLQANVEIILDVISSDLSDLGEEMPDLFPVDYKSYGN